MAEIVRTGQTGYEYGRTPSQFDVFGLLDAFTPMRRPVVSPGVTRYEDIDGAMYPTEVTPAEYGEPEFGFSYMPAVQAVTGLLSDPVGAAKAIPGAMAGQIEDYGTASLGALEGGYEGMITPEGEPVEASPILPMEYLLGGGIAAMRQPGVTLGAMGGRGIEDTALFQQIAKRPKSLQMPEAERLLYEAAAEFQLPRDPGEGLLLPGRAYEYGARTAGAADEGLLIDPGFENLVRASPDPDAPGTVIRDLDTLAASPVVDLQSLIGRTAKLMPGDMTMAGKEITHVMGVKLRNPVRMQGGKDFPAEELSRELGLVWASHPNVISGYAKQARENPGLLGIYTAMGARSNDFSHHVADVLVDMTKQAKKWIPEDQIAAFNEKVKNFSEEKELADGSKVTVTPYKDFPGITSPNIEKYLYSPGKGGARKAVADIMEKNAFRKVGFPDVPAVRAIVSEPSLRNRVNDPTGQLAPTGARIVEFDADPYLPMGGVGNIARFNKSYAQGISGTDMGALGIDVPRILIAPDFYARRRLEGKKPASDRRSAEISNVLQTITPEIADDVSVYQEMYRRGLEGKGIL